MNDETLDDFREVLARKQSSPDSKEMEIMNAPSYDIINMSEYFKQFKYLPMHKREEGEDYSHMNEVRRILDYPYYFESFDLDDLFVGTLPNFIKKDDKKRALFEKYQDHTMRSEPKSSVQPPEVMASKEFVMHRAS